MGAPRPASARAPRAEAMVVEARNSLPPSRSALALLALPCLTAAAPPGPNPVAAQRPSASLCLCLSRDRANGEDRQEDRGCNIQGHPPRHMATSRQPIGASHLAHRFTCHGLHSLFPFFYGFSPRRPKRQRALVHRSVRGCTGKVLVSPPADQAHASASWWARMSFHHCSLSSTGCNRSAMSCGLISSNQSVF